MWSRPRDRIALKAVAPRLPLILCLLALGLPFVGTGRLPAAAQQNVAIEAWTEVSPSFDSEICTEEEVANPPADGCWAERPHLRGVSFLDSENGWAVGDAPTIMKKDGEGNTFFLNTGDALILRTTDGGKSWKEERSKTALTESETPHDLAAPNRLDDIVFSSPDRAYAVGKRNTRNLTSEQVVLIGKVNRQGDSPVKIDWELRSTPSPPAEADNNRNALYGLRAISCSDEKHCFAAGHPQSIVITTEDGWNTRRNRQTDLVHNLVDYVTAVALADGPLLPDGQICAGCYGYVIAADGVIATRDGGKTWTRQSGSLHGSKGSTYLKAANGIAQEVQPQTGPCDNSCQHDLWFADYSTGYGVRGAEIFRTTDAGENWIRQNNPVLNRALHSIACSSKTTCWAVGDGGTIIFTNDGGNWAPQATGVDSRLNEVALTSDPATGLTTVYAVGDEGVVLKMVTTISGTSEPLNDISCSDSSRCHAVGNGGTVLATTDGGKSWERQRTPAATASDPEGLRDRTHFSGVSFTDADRGHTVGERTILSTSDGGKSWQSQSFPPLDTGVAGLPKTNVPARLNDVAFTHGPDCGTSGRDVGFEKGCYGFAVGEGGTVMATSDGGRTWSERRTRGAGSDLNAVAAANHLQGYAVGKGGTVIATSNGTGWSTESEVSGLVGGKELKDVFVTPSGDAYAVGADATMIAKKTHSGGTKRWKRIGGDLPFSGHLSGVAFANLEDGIAVGQTSSGDPLIVETKDGGETWAIRPSPSLPNGGAGLSFSGVSYTETRTTGLGAAFVVGSGGTIVRLLTSSVPQLPSVFSISPNFGPPETATPVRITGANLLGATSVSFGSVDAAPLSVTDSALLVEAPPQKAGTVDVWVTVEGVRSNALVFTYGHIGGVADAGTSIGDIATGLASPPLGLVQPPTTSIHPPAIGRARSAATGGGQDVVDAPVASADSPAVTAGKTLPAFSPLTSERIIQKAKTRGEDTISWLASIAGFGGIACLAILTGLLVRRYRPPKTTEANVRS